MVRRDIAYRHSRSEIMADHVVPHFHNDPGVPVIEIGAHEFMCVGAKPPFDHPHVFLDMGDDNGNHLPLLLDAVPARSVARPACAPGRNACALTEAV